MNQKTNTIFLGITHPLMIMFYALMFYMCQTYFSTYTTLTPGFLLQETALMIFTVIVFPVSIIFGLYKMKIINTWTVDSKEDRSLAFPVVVFSYFMALNVLDPPKSLSGITFILLAGVLMGVVNWIISVFWKISLHTMGLGCLLFYFLMYSLSGKIYCIPIIAVILLAGLVGSQRLYVKAHTPAQVYAGFLVGLLTPFLCLFIVFIITNIKYY